MTVTVLGICIPLGKLLNSSGLVLDISGAILLFRFGLPADVSRAGATLLAAGYDEAEREKAKAYDRLGRLGLFLLVAGFVLQLASDFF